MSKNLPPEKPENTPQQSPLKTIREQQAAREKNNKADNQRTPDAEVPAFNREDHPQRQLG